MPFANHSGDLGKGSDQRKPDLLGKVIEDFLQEFIVVFSMGIWGLIKSFFNRRIFITAPILAGLAIFTWWVIRHAMHFQFIHYLEPQLFTYNRLKWLQRFSYSTHFAVLFSVFVTPLILSTGMMMRATRTKFQRIFRQAGLTNGLGDTPKLNMSMMVKP